MITFIAVTAAAGGLYLLVERTRLGTTMRAVVDDPSLLDATGVAPARVRQQAWLIGSCFAAASGVLLASQQRQLDVTLLSLLVVQAFGAAALGAFRSLPMAYAGGLIIGVAQKIVEQGVRPVRLAAGPRLQPAVHRPVRRPARAGPTADSATSARRCAVRAAPPLAMSAPAKAFSGSAVLLVAVLIPHLVGARLPIWTNAMSQVLLFLSLGLLVHTSGQVSLCQVSLAAVGAASFAHSVSSGVPWGFAVLFAGLVAVPVGAIVAIPAIRLSGLFLALATLGFGILIAQFFYVKSYMFGLTDLKTARPQAFGLETDKGYYYLLLVIAVVGILSVTMLERSRLGRLLRGLSDSPTALATLGASANVSRVLVFCISAFLAGISGALFAGQFGSVSGTSFNFVLSLVLLAVLAMSGRSTISGAIIGPVSMVVLPSYASSLSNTFQVLFGAGAILAAIASTRRLDDMPVERWAQASAWRLESTTKARTAHLQGAGATGSAVP